MNEPALLRHALLFVHLAAAMGWLGGMFFAHFCLRPAAVQTLAPPQRLPLLCATFARFLRLMDGAVVLILATGAGLMAATGVQAAPLGWKLMAALGLVMAAVFAYIRSVVFPGAAAHCAAARWPQAGEALNRMRQLVALNMALGTAAVAAAVAAR